MQATVIVLGISRYQFEDDQTGKVIQGTKIHYVESEFQNEENSAGVIPQVANMPYDYFEEINLKHVPGVYSVDLSVSLRGRKPILKVERFEYQHEFPLNKLAIQTTKQPANTTN